MAITVIAPIGQGMPWKTPGRIFTVENRASRSTTASSTVSAISADSRLLEPGETMPQTATK